MTKNNLKSLFVALAFITTLGSQIGLAAQTVGATAPTGAGEQSSAPTLASLTGIRSATTIAQVKTATQTFATQYGVTIYTTCPDVSHVDSGGTDTCNALTEADLTNAKYLAIEFVQEWSKYTPAWVTASQATKVYLITGFKRAIGTANALVPVAALPGVGFNGPLYDASFAQSEDYMREVIHHEYDHFIEYNKYGNYTRTDATWSGYNTAGFTYGSGGVTCYQTNSTCTLGQHPQAGFVTGYAKSAIEEDKAETYAYIFWDGGYTDLLSWDQTDTNLASKVTNYKALITSVDATMNAAYFQAIHDYGALHDTITGNTSTGTTANNPDGSFTTTISSTEDDSLASYAAGHGGNELLIVDGKLGDVSVGTGSTIQGSGQVGNLDLLTGAHLAPGHSPGCLQSNNLTLESGSIYDAQIGGKTACTGYDQMQVTGTVDVTGATLNASLYGGFVPSVGDMYTIISNDGSDAVTGTFSGQAEGSTITADGVTYRISYIGGDGNDVVLTVTAVNGTVAAAASAPKAPNTGLAAVIAHPILSLMVSTAAALLLFGLSRRLAPAPARVRSQRNRRR